MIQEVIVSTQNTEGKPHLAPMGICTQANKIIIQPFRPSNTLNNILTSKTAVINYCDDVRVFADCVGYGRHRPHWQLKKTAKIQGYYLAITLAHEELQLLKVEDDVTRPTLFCKVIHRVNHAPFRGFNRAQYVVLEATILASRLHLLPFAKIKAEIAQLKIILDKTGGADEYEAWNKLMIFIEQHKQKQV